MGLALMKGCRHGSLAEVELTSTGPADDRELCLVEVDSRRVVRTVEHPELMRLRVWRSGADLSIEFPAHTVRDEPRSTGAWLRCDYWGRNPELELLESAHAVELSNFVGRRVVLARTTRTGDIVYGDPITLVTVTDLAELAERFGEPSLAEESARFRATVTIDDGGILRGDCVGRRLRMGDACVEITGPIPRCALIDHDPVTGIRDRALLKTLGTYRREGSDIWFGHYARVLSPGACRVGDPVACDG